MTRNLTIKIDGFKDPINLLSKKGKKRVKDSYCVNKIIDKEVEKYYNGLDKDYIRKIGSRRYKRVQSQ